MRKPKYALISASWRHPGAATDPLSTAICCDLFPACEYAIELSLICDSGGVADHWPMTSYSSSRPFFAACCFMQASKHEGCVWIWGAKMGYRGAQLSWAGQVFVFSGEDFEGVGVFRGFILMLLGLPLGRWLSNHRTTQTQLTRRCLSGSVQSFSLWIEL